LHYFLIIIIIIIIIIRQGTGHSQRVPIHNLTSELYKSIGQVVGLGQGISPTKGLYLHGTTQHTKTQTHIHALNGIQTHDSSVRVA